tara:strand:- start:46059 stop:46346 length:288 start_codon:yes stop_codon:yes gene_type:complete
MKHLKIIGYMILILSLANFVFSGYMYNELNKKNVQVDIVLPENLRSLAEDSKRRESVIIQAIMVMHHTAGIHPPGQEPLCPFCQQNNLKTVRRDY